MIEHWMTAELRGSNASFQRSAREYAEEYAAMAVANVMKWRPIEIAPRDGLLLLLCTAGGNVFVGRLNKHLHLWVDDQGVERFRPVAYWMPLPAAPEEGGTHA